MPARPNVVLFITHDSGRHLSPYGINEVHTPYSQRLASEGVLFSNAFCTSPLCSPSRAACVTGRYPHQNGVMGLTADPTGAFDLYDGEAHAAALFGHAGYEAVLCGFEHETRDCAKAGFETLLCGQGRFNGGGDLRDYGNALDGWLKERPADRPFYLQIGCHETHRVYDRHDTQPDASNGVWMPPYLKDLDEIRQDMAGLQGAVRRLDEGLGAILAALAENGAAEDTIFVFTTDHGIDLPRAKGTCFDPGIETFLIVRYPAGDWGADRRQDEMISNVDILPTLLEACGIEIPTACAGQSFLPLLQGRAYTPNEAVFAEKTYHDTYDPIRCARTARYKYIRYFEVNIFEDLRLATMEQRHWWNTPWRRANREEALYDIEADPLEMKDVATRPEYAQAKGEMRRLLADWMRRTSDPLLDGPVSSPYYRAALEGLLDSETES